MSADTTPDQSENHGSEPPKPSLWRTLVKIVLKVAHYISEAVHAVCMPQEVAKATPCVDASIKGAALKAAGFFDGLEWKWLAKMSLKVAAASPVIAKVAVVFGVVLLAVAIWHGVRSA